jgi:hypothetical protein
MIIVRKGEQMIDHRDFRIRNLKAARQFYDAWVAVLGLAVIDNATTQHSRSIRAEWMGKQDFAR